MINYFSEHKKEKNMAAVPNTITSALELFGSLADTNNIIFNGSNASESIVNKVFNNKFNTCIDLELSDLEKHCKTHGALTFAKGHIIIIPSTKVNIRDISIE